MATATVKSKDAEFVAGRVAARRTQFALNASKHLVRGCGIDVAFQVILWLVFPQYPQLLAVGILVSLLGLAVLYPTLRRLGREKLGNSIFLGAVVLTTLVVPLLLPEVTLAAMVGYVVIIIINYLFLGDNRQLAVECRCEAAVTGGVVSPFLLTTKDSWRKRWLIWKMKRANC